MKTTKYSMDRVSFSYKGASVFATGNLAKVITYGFVGLVLLIGIAVVQNARSVK